MIVKGGDSSPADDLSGKPVPRSGQHHPGVLSSFAAPSPTRRSNEHYRRRNPVAVSVAAAGPHHHVLVFLQYDVGVVVKVEH